MWNIYPIAVFFWIVGWAVVPRYSHAQDVDTIRILQLYHRVENQDGSQTYTDRVVEVVEQMRPDILFLGHNSTSDTDVTASVINTLTHLRGRGIHLFSLEGDTSAGSICYNHKKLTLESKDRIIMGYNNADIGVLRLFYKGDFSSRSDTIYLTCFLAHVNQQNNFQKREEDCQKTMQNIEEYCSWYNIKGNVLVMGNLNSPESGRDETSSFDDKPSSNSFFDNRFNYILMGRNMYGGDHNLRVVPESYKKVYSRGKREIQGKGVKAGVAPLVNGNSIYLELQVLGQVKQLLLSQRKVLYNNPVHDELRLNVNWGCSATLTVEILSIIGKPVYHRVYNGITSGASWNIPVSSLEKGLYFLKITDQNKKYEVRKIMKY